MILEPVQGAAERARPLGAFKTDMAPRPTLAALAGLAFLTLAGCGGSNEVASVNNEGISLEEFNQYLATKRTVRVVVQNQVVEVPVSETLGFQALQELATRKLVMQMASDEGLMPTEQEIEAEIKFKTAINPQYLNELTSVGFSFGQIRREVAYAMCEERLLTRGIDVKMDEVDQMMKENPQQFIEPATVTVYQILTNSEARREQVDSELRASVPFKQVATNRTIDPQGPRKQYATERLAEPLKSALEGKPISHVTDWIDAGNGAQAKYFIEARTESKPVDMTPERKELLRRQIALNYGRQANDLPRQVADKLRGSDVRISDDQETLNTMWKRFKDRLVKAVEESESTPVGNGQAP